MEQKFDGLKVGCDCRDKNGSISSKMNLRKPDHFLDETCSYQEKVSGCVITDEVAPQWMTIFSGKMICKKALPFDHTNIKMDIIATQDTQCPEGKRKCGAEGDWHN